jgi:hypothetical protein
MEMDGSAIGKLVELNGIWNLLLRFASVSAEERGQGSIDTIDLVLAIYIVDLEHVMKFWDDWTHFESFILNIPLIDGRRRVYLHRSEHLFRIWSAAREAEGKLTFYPPPSRGMLAIVESAQELVQARNEEGLAPTSLDFLYAVCSTDPGMSEVLQRAGLQLEMLEAAVKPSQE